MEENDIQQDFGLITDKSLLFRYKTNVVLMSSHIHIKLRNFNNPQVLAILASKLLNLICIDGQISNHVLAMVSLLSVKLLN